jgi:hypothetical protein
MSWAKTTHHTLQGVVRPGALVGFYLRICCKTLMASWRNSHGVDLVAVHCNTIGCLQSLDWRKHSARHTAAGCCNTSFVSVSCR